MPSSGYVVRMAENAEGNALEEICRTLDDAFQYPLSVSAYPEDRSCWVAEQGTWNDMMNSFSGSAVVHLAADGTELWRSDAFYGPWSVSVDPKDGSCWVADTNNHRVVHLDKEGNEIWSHSWGGFFLPLAVAVNPADGSCWVGADVGAFSSEIMHLAADGTVLWRSAHPYHMPRSLSVDPNTGACWVAASGRLTRLLPHSILVTATCDPTTVPSGGSTACTASFSDTLDHAAASWHWDDNGAGGTFSPSPDVQNPTYTAPANTGNSDLLVTLTLSATCDGPEPLSDSDSVTLTVQPEMHSFAVTAGCDPATVASGGTTACSAQYADTLGHGVATWYWEDGGAGGVFNPSAQQQNPIYTAPENTSDSDLQVTLTVEATCDGPEPLADSDSVILTVQPTGMFSDVPQDHWARNAIEACFNAGIVSGYEDGQYYGDWPVTRGQMAVFIARGLAGGDEYVPEWEGEPTFPDVTPENEHAWCYKYVEYVAGCAIVGGYEDGTYQPVLVVTRDQMAVYAARSIVDPTGEDGLIGYEPPATPTFPDVPEDWWAYAHVEYCFEAGVVQGYPYPDPEDPAETIYLYMPEEEVTRDQMAVYIARAFDL